MDTSGMSIFTWNPTFLAKLAEQLTINQRVVALFFPAGITGAILSS
jgi:hypothetical protein